MQEIIKNTDPNSVDFPILQDAQDKIHAIISIINEGARHPDGTRRIIDIQNNFNEVLFCDST